MKNGMSDYKVIDFEPVLDYFKKLKALMLKIYPEDVPLEQHNIWYEELLNYRHPKWIQDYFPVVLILYKPKAGKLRKSKNWSVAFQNNMNVMTQVCWTANNFGMYQRKNEHKGFKKIVAAIPAHESDLNNYYSDKQKPRKFKNFHEMAQVLDPADIYLRALCEVLQENYPCDSHGQLRLL